MTAASNALEELQHARYLTEKGLIVALRRIDPTTKAFLSEMYYSSAQEAECVCQAKSRPCDRRKLDHALIVAGAYLPP